MAADRLMEMLSFGGDVLVFQCKTSSSKSRDHRRGSEVSFRSLSFDRDSRSFSVRERETQPLHRDGSAETALVHCASAEDVRQRLRVPCVLLKLCRKRASAFRYMLYSAEGRLHVEFALPYEMRENISILQGPTLVWSHENSVFYASSRTGGVKEVPVPMTVKFIGELPLHQRKLVIYGTRSDGNNILYFIEEEEEERCNAACLVPDAYSAVIQCMMVSSAEEVGGSFKSAVLAATSMKQLVGFENGLPRDVCPLPYEQPLSIRLVHTLKNECLVVVTFSRGNVCAVWRDTFQVASCWTGVRLLLVDDFVGCGTDQMLLVFEEPDSSGETLSNFLLTDLCGITYSCGRSDALNTSDAAQENFLLTVQALESRLQSGLNFLEDLQRDVEVKDRLILQSCEALTDLVSGRDHVIFPPEQEGLVSLWDDDDDAGDEEHDGMQTECAEALLKVDRVWQRVIGQSLIVGVVLRPENNTCVGNISASVAVDSCHTLMNCKILRFPASVAHGPSAAKKIRCSDGSADVSRLALVAVTDVAPLLTSGCVRCPIMLHYSTKEPSGSPPGDGARVSQYCGRISVDLRDISTGKLQPRLLQDSRLNTEEASEDLLSLQAVLDTWCFLVESRDHTLPDVQGWLRESLRAERLDVDPRFTADPSDVRLFQWEQRSPFQAVLSVRCRDELRLLQFLHSLCDFLPASHHIQLLESPRSRGSALAQTLETEIRTVMQEVSAVLRCEEGGVQEEPDASSEPLQRLREEWQRERGRYHNRLRPLVDATPYSRLVERLIDTQLDADEAALIHSNIQKCE